MVFMDDVKGEPCHGTAVDQLLEEYLRVINDKDHELHRLLRQLEDQQSSSRQSEEAHKTRLKDVTQQLRRREAKVQELRQQCSHDEELNGKLVQHAETLKVQLQSSEEKSQALTERVAQLSDSVRELEDGTAALRSTVAALEAQKAEDTRVLATTRQMLSAAQASATTLQERCKALTEMLEERQAQVEQLQGNIRTMISRSEHAEAVKALENAAAAAKDWHARELDELQRRLQRKCDEAVAAEQSLRTAHSRIAELTEALQENSKTLTNTRYELATAAAAAQQTEKALREEVSRRKVAQQELAERVGELERAVTRSHDAAQRTAAELQEAQLQHERCKAEAEKAMIAGQAQLRSAQEQLCEAQAAVEGAKRRFEAKERAAVENADVIARLQVQLARAEADARESTATLTAALTAKKDDCDRLEGELKKTQVALRETQNRSAVEERTLRHKFDEVELAVQRLQVQLRDKEEDTRRLVLVHSSEMQKMKDDCAAAVEEMRRRHEAEVRDFNTRIERFRADLGEQAGGSKGLERELQYLEEARREVRREADRLQGLLESKEAALQTCRMELEKLHAEMAQLTQRAAVNEKTEAAMRQRLEEAERAQLNWKAAAERAQETEAALKKAAESTAASVAALEEQIARKDAALTAARREAEELIEARQAALKEGMQQKVQREQLGLKLASAEERLAAAASEIRDAAQEQKRMQRALDECRADLRRAEEATEQRNAECARLTRHAEEVETLAKRTSDELQRNLEARDDTIRQLRSEQATLIPHFSEERSKSLVLQEKLQRQEEDNRRCAEAAAERMRVLECERAAREADVVVLRAEKAHLEQQVSDANARADSLKATLESREHKYQQRKEEMQKALSQVEEVKAATVSTLQEAEVQSAAANALREKYKKEKAKMEALLQRMEQKVRDATNMEKNARQREESLNDKLQNAEDALRRVQESMASRVSETKLHYDELCRKQEASLREAVGDAQAAEQHAKALQAQLLDAQRRATTTENSLRELQRHLAAHQLLAIEAYADEAIDMKRACTDTVVRAHRVFLSHAASCVRDGWVAAVRTVQSSRSTVEELQGQLTRAEASHQETLRAVAEAHARRLEAAAAEHREDVARLQRDITEAKRRADAEKDALKRAEDTCEQRCRALEESVERLRALLELEKTQSAAYRDRVAAEEATRAEAARVAQEERRALQRSHDKLKRQLDDRAVERQHNEDELREQRAEVAALQRVLSEKECECKLEIDRMRREVEKAVAVAAARDAAVQQCEALRQQADFVRGQLESARSSHQRVLQEQQAMQRTQDARLEAAQTELATAAAEKRRVQADLSSRECRVEELMKEVQALRRQEADLLSQLHACKSEISALRERCANLESLKNISDATLTETQNRERDLLEKIEELRNAQQLMQVCFDKQQEQLEIGRRLRQHDAQVRSQYSP